MPKMKFEEIEVMLSRGRLFPVYLICGEQHYLTRVVVDKIRDVYHAETGAETERLSAKGLDTVTALDSLKTLPMWTKGKLLIVDETHSLTQTSKDLILDYVKSPSSTAVLVLVASKFDGRSKLYKLIAENGAVVEISTIYENRMTYWINRECRLKGYNISHEAAEFMTELVGTDLSKMSGAVEKIILYIGNKKTIDLQDVETVLSDTSQKSIFDLTNAVGSRNLLRAENRLLNLLRNNESPVVIVNMLARHWRFLIKAKEFLRRGAAAERDVASMIGVNRFFVREYISQSKNFTLKSLVAGLKKLSVADKAIKSSRLPKEAILHRIIIDLSRPH